MPCACEKSRKCGAKEREQESASSYQQDSVGWYCVYRFSFHEMRIPRQRKRRFDLHACAVGNRGFPACALFCAHRLRQSLLSPSSGSSRNARQATPATRYCPLGSLPVDPVIAAPVAPTSMLTEYVVLIWTPAPFVLVNCYM